MRPHILIVNDDGIYAPGIRYLWEAIKPLADITIVAPADQQSGAGQSISMYRPLRLKEIRWEGDVPAYSVSGTPADCVKMALAQIFDTPPDLVVSGINPGHNAGSNVFYSGTVGAAIEAIYHHIPAAAFSIDDHVEPNYETTLPYIPHIIDFVLGGHLPEDTLLNVNFPAADPKGLRLARQGHAYWREVPAERTHPEGFPYYWLAGEQAKYDEHHESDVKLLADGYVAAVPVRVRNLTHEDVLEQHRGHFEQYRSSAT